MEAAAQKVLPPAPYRCVFNYLAPYRNHVHLLATPTKSSALGNMMQMLGRRYVSYINGTYRRSGTLWEGRYKACLVDTESYLLTCYRYIELNPVRAAMADSPEKYSWSSYHANALGQHDPLVRPHAQYLSLAPTAEQRYEAYRELFKTAIDDDRLADIRSYIQQQRALGTTKFQQEIEATIGRCVKTRPAHRPPRRHPDPTPDQK
jgi:putative transposase